MRCRKKQARKLLLRAVAAGLAIVGPGGIALSAPVYKGPPSDHFDGKRFPSEQKIRPGGIFRLIFTYKRGPWKPHRDAPPGPPPPRRVGRGRLRVTFVSHSTALIQMDGVNILTDPVWSERASPVSFAGPRRVRPPGIRFEDLPPIHVVLLSHNHYDHLDLPTLKRLQERDKPLIVTGLGNGLLLGKKQIDPVTELDWWQSVRLPHSVSVIATPARHFSGRGFGDRNGTLWTGFIVKGSKGYVFFAGDTGYGSHFRAIRRKHGRPRLALLPIGAYRPEEIMGAIHMNPAEAVRAHRDLGSRFSVPIHFGTFRVAADGEDEPVSLLMREIGGDKELAGRFRVLGFGEGLDVP